MEKISYIVPTLNEIQNIDSTIDKIESVSNNLKIDYEIVCIDGFSTDGTVEKIKPTEIRKVLEPRAASLVSGMLVNVIDSGQAGAATVPGYYVGGKTGTAQKSTLGGYSKNKINTFASIFPISNPKFNKQIYSGEIRLFKIINIPKFSKKYLCFKVLKKFEYAKRYIKSQY